MAGSVDLSILNAKSPVTKLGRVSIYRVMCKKWCSVDCTSLKLAVPYNNTISTVKFATSFSL